MTGFSAPRLRRLDDTIEAQVNRGAIPGLVALVARGDTVHVAAAGAQDLATGVSMARDTIFRIASMTKPIAAAAAMVLVEEGRLRLDEPVDRLLPELANRQVLRTLESELDDTVAANRPITLRDLLTFRCGFGAVMAMPGAYPIQKAMGDAGFAPGPSPADFAPDDWIAHFAELPLIAQPGESWLYHTGSDILGILIARAAGQPFDAFLDERIFAPLGMTDTGFHVPADKIGRLATSYMIDRESGRTVVYDPAEGGRWSRPPVFASGGGGLVSTVDDYLAFSRMMLNGGRAGDRHRSGRILSRATVELMTTDQILPAQKAVSPFYPGFWDSHGWGFGMSVITARHGYLSVGSYGWDGGMGTSARNDPKEGLTCILLTQRMMRSPVPEAVYTDIWALAYQALDD
jgi:CubicO group peptidase (beta-lactamase class C family)